MDTSLNVDKIIKDLKSIENEYINDKYATTFKGFEVTKEENQLSNQK